MTMNEIKMYRVAGSIARALMGDEKANRDPLAWWSLVELLVGFAAKHGHVARASIRSCLSGLDTQVRHADD